MTLSPRLAYLEHTVHKNDKMPYRVLHISDTLEHTLPYKTLVRTGGHVSAKVSATCNSRYKLELDNGESDMLSGAYTVRSLHTTSLTVPILQEGNNHAIAPYPEHHLRYGAPS